MVVFTQSKLTLSLLITSVTLPLVHCGFNADSDSNVAIYWGQGPNQKRLADYCADPSIDIINLAFVNVFPDQAPGNWPGDDFGNACEIGIYQTSQGVQTLLRSNCPTIGPDITTCQSTYGKKIFLSIGGALPGDGYIASSASAKSFGDFLWGAFGPLKSSWTSAGLPRPFGSAVVDGFDLDIESTGISAAQQSQGWATMVNHLKDDLFPSDPSKAYFLSSAPQCVLPDAHLSDAIANSWFDFIFVQFYNTPYCSARAGVDRLEGRPDGNYDISLDGWFAAPSHNPSAKIYIGLPASEDAASSPSFYLQPSEVKSLVDAYRSEHSNRFGGISLWDATRSEDMPVSGAPYVDAIKSVLTSNSGQPALGNVPEIAATTAFVVASATVTPTPVTTSFHSGMTTRVSAAHTSSRPSSTARPQHAASSSCSNGRVSCSTPGNIVCIGTTQFGICDIDNCAVPQQLAAGTTCANGQVIGRAAKTKRVNLVKHEAANNTTMVAAQGRAPDPVASDHATFVTIGTNERRSRQARRRDTQAARLRRMECRLRR